MPAPLVGAVIAGVVTTAAAYTVPWLIKVALFTLGLGVVSMVGLDLAFDYGINTVLQYYNGLPSTILLWADYIGVFDALSILFSAMNASLAIKFLCGATSAGRKVKKLDFVCD